MAKAKAKETGGGRKKKDPNAPKRPLAPYMFYCKDHRELVKQRHPDITFGEIGKILGENWSKLTDKEKKPFVARAEKDKERYLKEMARYEAES